MSEGTLPSKDLAPSTPAHTQDQAAPVEAAPPVMVADAEPPAASAVDLPTPGRIAQFILTAFALFVVGWLFWSTRSSMLPFIFGLVLAYLLMPVVDRLARGMPRPLAIVLVYINALVLTLFSAVFIVPPLADQTQRLVSSIPSIDSLQDTGNWFLEEYQRRVPEALREPIDNAALNALGAVQSNLANYAQMVGRFLVDQSLRLFGTLTFLIGFLIIPIWLFYVLNDKRQGRDLIDSMLHRRVRPDFWNSWSLIDKTFSDYIRGQLILCAAVGVAVGIGLYALRLLGFEVPYILLLAIIAGATGIVPIIGPVIGAIPAVLVALLGTDNPIGTAVAVIAVFVIVQQLESNLLVPRIVGESVGIHPAILTVLLIAMGDAFGFIGVVLSAPVAAVARDLFRYTYLRFGGASPALAKANVRVEKRQVDMKAVNEPSMP
jgi:predicted PurR-regulated permease PerM